MPDPEDYMDDEDIELQDDVEPEIDFDIEPDEPETDAGEIDGTSNGGPIGPGQQQEAQWWPKEHATPQEAYNAQQQRLQQYENWYRQQTQQQQPQNQQQPQSMFWKPTDLDADMKSERARALYTNDPKAYFQAVFDEVGAPQRQHIQQLQQYVQQLAHHVTMTQHGERIKTLSPEVKQLFESGRINIQEAIALDDKRTSQARNVETSRALEKGVKRQQRQAPTGGRSAATPARKPTSFKETYDVIKRKARNGNRK